jgi:hypothetical protein
MQGAGEEALWRAKKLLDTLLGNILRQVGTACSSYYQLATGTW